jgi:hypothetical protein
MPSYSMLMMARCQASINGFPKLAANLQKKEHPGEDQPGMFLFLAPDDQDKKFKSC